MSQTPRYSDTPYDFDVLKDANYRGKYILYGPATEEGMTFRMTTPSEQAFMDAGFDAEQARWSVYFIQQGADGPIKIGVTVDVEKRRRVLQTGSAQTLVLLSTIKGTEKQEAELHRRFKHLRLRGEWFRPEPELLAYIAETVGDR